MLVSEEDASPIHFEELRLQSAETFTSVDNTVKKGLLEKQGHIRKNWKLRWFTLSTDGLLSYARPLPDLSGPNEQQILGAIYLNGSVICGSSDVHLTIQTPQGKRFPLRSPRALPGALEHWKDILEEYSRRPFTPPTITMSAYIPPPPLGCRHRASKVEYIDQEEAAQSVFLVRVLPRDGEGGNANFEITSKVLLSIIASGDCQGRVIRCFSEFKALQSTLLKTYPHLVLPPLRRHDLEAFLQRLCCHEVLRLCPDLHVFLNLLSTNQVREKSEFERQRQAEFKGLTDTVATTQSSGVFGRAPKFQFTDSVASKLTEMKADTQTMTAIIAKAAQHFVQAKKNEMAAMKTSQLAQEAFVQLGTTNSSMVPLCTELSEVLRLVAKASMVNIEHNDFEEGLTEYSQHVLPALSMAIDYRKSLILAYQLSISKANSDKQELLERLRNARLNPTKGPQLLKVTDCLRAIKRSEARVRSSEARVSEFRDRLESFSTAFHEEVLHFPRWFYRDFKAMLLSHVEQQIQFHDQCLSIWSAFLPKIQDIDVSNFDDPFDNWWLSLPSPPTISPVSVTLPAVDVRHHPSYRSRSNQSHGQDQSPNLPDVTATVPIHISDLTRSLDIGLAAPSQPIIKVESSVSDETASGSDSDLEPQRGAPVQGHSSLFQMVSIDVPLSPATGFPQPAAVPTEIPVFVPSEESFSEIVDAFDAVQDFLEVIRLPSPDATLSPDTTDSQVTFLSDIDLNNSTPSTPQPTDPFSDQSTQVPTDSHPNSLISSQVASSDSTAQEGASETAASPSEPTAVAPGARRPSSRRHARPASLLLNLPMLGSVRKIPGAVPAFRARAIFPHTSQQDFQLSFGAGQIFIIEGKHDGGWWSGVDVLTLERGYIPGSFVEALP